MSWRVRRRNCITCAPISTAARSSARLTVAAPHPKLQMRGIIVFAHGSRVESANQAVRVVAAEVGRLGDFRVEAAFLELGDPDLEGAAARLADAGVDSIAVIPYFLTLGLH